MISFFNPFYVDKLPKQEFADVSIVFAWLVFFNVILSYGMELLLDFSGIIRRVLFLLNFTFGRLLHFWNCINQ
jgi:hypothetical protein